MPISEQTAIDLKNLTKRYGRAAVVHSLNLSIPKGAVFGLLGPNGAGKSTTIKMMVGIVRPNEGEISVLGTSIQENPVGVKKVIGVVPDSLALFDYLSIFEHLDLVRSLFEIGKTDFEKRSAQLLSMLDLTADAGKLVRNASYGMRKKTALAMAMLPNPRVLILDEPFEGLDPIMLVSVKRALKAAASRRITVFITTHLLDIASDLITHYGILRSGCLVAQGAIEGLTARRITLHDEYMKYFDESPQRKLSWLG